MKSALFIIVLSYTFAIGNIAIAADFYGATVTDKDTPTAAFRAGIIGFCPTIKAVSYDSPAHKAGFVNGDVILTINGKKVDKASDLGKFTDNTLKVEIFSGVTQKTLIIDRLAIETEKANQLKTQRKPASITKPHITYFNERPDNSPPLKFDDKDLENKYGKTDLIEIENQRKNADESMRARAAEENRKKLEDQQRIDTEKLTKTTCEGGIPGECGPGRACVYDEFGGQIIKGSGICKTNAEADRIVAESNQRTRDIQQQQQHQQLMDKLDSADRQRDMELNHKIDSIDRKLKWGW